jgi:hypothetical protein
MSDYDPFAEGGTYDPFAGDYDPFADDDQEYSTGRQSVVSFFEGAIGLGTEVDALFRSAGSDMSYSEALKETQRRQSAFRDDNEALATATEWGGVLAGFVVPGGIFAKTGQAMSKGRQMAIATAEGAAMGAGYQFAAEDVETGDRGVMLGAALGGGLGLAAGKFALKTADELAKIDEELMQTSGRGTHIWGDQGVSQVDGIEKVREPNKIKDQSTSAEDRDRGLAMSVREGVASALLGEKTLFQQMREGIGWAAIGTREWIERNAGMHAGRLAAASEVGMRKMNRTIDARFDEFTSEADKLFDENPDAYEAFVNMGMRGNTSDVGPQIPKTYEQALKGMPENSPIRKMADTAHAIHANDFPAWMEGKQALEDYFPRKGKGKMDPNKRALVNDYEKPTVALKEYAEDVMDARQLAHVFFRERAPEVIKNLKPARNGQSRTEAVIDMIEKEAREQGMGMQNFSDAGPVALKADKERVEAAAHNLAAGLRATHINAKQGGAKVGSMVRKLSSTGLLANWSNAMLNMIEGVTLPIYNNGVIATAQAAVPAVGATINSIARQAGKKEPVFKMDWIDNQQMGLDRQFMGEVHADAKDGIAKTVDNLSRLGYKATGVHTVNTMGQEILGNSSVRKAMKEAKKAVRTGDFTKFGKLKGARGMSQKEIERSAKVLAHGDMNSPVAREWYGMTLGLLQPGYASSMPMAFNNHPNGRVFYGMLSYMNRQMNVIRSDIYLNAKDVGKYGINTAKGKDAYKAAIRNATLYAATMGMANGIWDDFRKDVFDGKKRDDWDEYYTGDARIRGYEIGDINDAVEFLGQTAKNQLLSNVSSGLLNARAEEYGGEMFNPLGAPAINMGVKGINAAADAATGDFEKAGKWAQTFVPGVAQADRIERAATGRRLMDRGGMLSMDTLYDLLDE